MKTELLTISKIFSEAIFRIPDYQRGYSWEESHLKDFWNDLEQLDLIKSHYTGVITLEPVPEVAWNRWEDEAWIIRSKKYSPYYVVDGQQRLTTVSILLQCILEKLDCDEINYTPIDIVRRKYIYETRSDSLAKAYIFGYEKDNPSRDFVRSEIFSEGCLGHSTGEATIYTRNLRNAKKFFSDRINSASHSDLENLFSKVTQQLVFNAYEISKEIDASVAFETMNNRGKPLSALELLKNRLIYLVTDIVEAEPGDRKMLRQHINDAWAVVYHNLGRNENRPLNDDEFLRAHLACYFHKKISKDIPGDDDQLSKFMLKAYEVLEDPSDFLLRTYFTRKRLTIKEDGEDLLSAKTIKEYSEDLKISAETYFKLSSPSGSGYSETENLFLERIGRIRGHGAGSLLISVFHREKNVKSRISFLEAYERYLFCSSIKGGFRFNYRGGSGFNAEIIKYIKGAKKIDDIISFYNNLVDKIFKEEHLVDVLHDWTKNGPSYYGWKSVRYFLYEYELYLQEQSRTERSKIDWNLFSKEDYQSDYVSVEHIYPQRTRSTYWTERFGYLGGVQKRVVRNSLGNLLALSTPKNSSLGNKPFPEKVGRTGTTVGYRFGSYSENEVASLDNWGPNDILERGVRMLDFMESRWKLSVGDRGDKIRALGLQFL